jgi:putative endonuclease
LPREPCVYILANRRRGTLYTGVTSNLAERVFRHRQGLTPGFTSRYGCNRLVFYEKYERMDEAIAREKQIKGGSRGRKISLVEAINPEWKDLYETLA